MFHNTIFFYRVDERFGAFSNFAPFPIEIEGVVWPTSEHYFQAQKFADPALQRQIRKTPSPMEAAQMGRRLPGLREDWDLVRDEVMMDALWAKFTQHKGLKRLLLGTDGSRLVEHTANDSYWADGGDGTGANRLGELLMELRDELASREPC